MADVHPSALVDPAARLGRGTRVGPFAVIDAGAELGENCVVDGHAQVRGAARVGSDCRIGSGTIVGGDPQDLDFDPATESFARIGDRCVLREFVTVHRAALPGAATEVGEDVFLMAGAHVGHDARVGNGCVIANNALLAGHVVVGDGVFLGGGTVVHQFIRVGDLCIIQGNSALSRDVPPYCIAAQLNRLVGLNVVGLRRAGFDAAARAEIKAAFDHVFHGGRNLAQSLASAQSRQWSPRATIFLDFLARKSQKGVCFPK